MLRIAAFATTLLAFSLTQRSSSSNGVLLSVIKNKKVFSMEKKSLLSVAAKPCSLLQH